MNKHVSYKLFSIVGLLLLGLSVKIVHPAVVPISPINIVAVPGASYSMIFEIARVYQEPNYTSRVIEAMSPGEHFNILGYDGSGAFTAIAREGQSSISGWIPTSQITRNFIDGTSYTLSMGYLAQSSTSPVTNVLTPGQKVKVLGHSPDGNWLAIANPSSLQTPLYWVVRYDISLPAVMAKTVSLTMIHQKPSNSSLITNVLDPTHQLILIGRTSDSSWYAANDFSSGRFIGWVMSGDVAGGIYRDLLPEINIK